MKLSEYAGFDAIGLMDLVARKEVTLEELDRCARAAIKQLNPALNFMAGPLTPVAAAHPQARFHGLPFLFKDGDQCAGQAATLGSRLLKGLKAPADGEYARRIKASGVSVLGSTTGPEFALYGITESLLHGATRNPWNLDHSPGGSSGGSSAAVAAGVVPVASSSDGGGSIRLPAHCCGIFGLKPSRGRTANPSPSDGGLFPYAAFHVATRSVRDSAAFLDCIHGRQAGSRFYLPLPQRSFSDEVGAPAGRLKIAYTRSSPSHTPLHPDCLAAIDQAIRLCESLGHDLIEAAPAIDWQSLMTAFRPSWVALFPLALGQIETMLGRKAGPDTLDAMTLKAYEYSKTLGVNDLLRAEMVFQATRIAMDAFMERYDAWISPTAVCPAPRIGEFDPTMTDESMESYAARMLGDYAAFAPLLNITGHPAASVPLYQGAAGLPIGIQIAARMADEATIIRLASQLEEALPWKQRHPPVSVFAAA